MTDMVEKVAQAIASANIMDLEGKAYYRWLAQKAIATMREPTEEMLHAGPPEPYMDKEVWARMIDAALEGKG